MSVEEAVRMWEVFRAGFINELENIPEDQWSFRVGDGARSVHELALHVAGFAEGFTDELLAKEPSFMRVRDPQVQERLAARFSGATSKESTIEALRKSMTSVAERLRGAAEMLSQQKMQSFGREASRESGLWFAAGHEGYHRGQLTAYERALRIVPAMTKGTPAPAKK